MKPAALCFVALTVTLSAFTSSRPSGAQSTTPDSGKIADGLAMMRLASLLVGTRDAPACAVKPPQGELVWFEGGDYCEWPINARGRVGAQRDQQHRLRALTMKREAKSKANARAIVDSIGSTLRSWGLGQRDCGSGSTPAGEVRAWVYARSDLVVHLSEITPPSGPPRLAAVAVDDPSAFPAALCPPANGR